MGKLSDWSPENLEKSADRAGRIARIVAVGAVVWACGFVAFAFLTDGITGIGIAFQIAAVSFAMGGLSLNRRMDAATRRRRAELEADLDALKAEGYVDPMTEPVADMLRSVPRLFSASSMAATAMIGRALAEGWDVDQITEATNLPGAMVRSLAEQAEKGI